MTLLQRTGIIAGHKVIDVGFRDVQELQAIASLVGPTGSVLGIDIIPRRVQSARQELEGLSGHAISVLRGSVLDIPADDDAFDLVLCKGMLHEVRQLGRALAEMARVCKPEGLISILDIQRFSRLSFELYRLKALLRGRRTHDVHPGFTREQLLKLLSEQRLDEIKYEQLSSTWRLGSNAVPIFLLQARPGS